MNTPEKPNSPCARCCRPDVPLLAEIFRASIEELTAEDYSEAQQEAWARSPTMRKRSAAKLAARADAGGDFRRRTGRLRFARRQTRIDMLYVHPAATGQGAGRACDAIEKLAARARRQGRSRVDASDTARGFFEKRGYTPRAARRVSLDGEWLANTTMIKPLPGRRNGQRMMKRSDTPFPRHWVYYLVLKYAVIAGAVAIVSILPFIGSSTAGAVRKVETVFGQRYHAQTVNRIFSDQAASDFSRTHHIVSRAHRHLIAVALASNYYLW